ncbi:cytochrome C oxidase subunit IV family protein [Aeromicrobium alkaliterrae]|uniref:Prokaryotic cytochrome C oxidase subunit IV family protein n=1 Tax=Aeromicrobium alkaliterrae TaxID=302168 RepID=A0ABP4WAL5_9ACTN
MSDAISTADGAQVRRVQAVFVLLVTLTLVALWFTTSSAHDLLSGRGAAAVAAAVAFVKARFVALEFMELRGTRVQPLFDGWLAVVGVVCLVLVLR